MKELMENSTNVKFKLISISNEYTSVIPDGIDLSTITDESLQFQYKIGTVIKLADHSITVVPRIRYCIGETIVFEANAEFNYSVSPLDTVMDVDLDNKKLNMKVNLFPTLVGAAYSSLRGIVYARTLSTPLEKYPLPLIDIDTLLSKNGISVLK